MATAAEMVTVIKTALENTPVGLVSVTVDGQTTRWDRADLRTELSFWEGRAAEEAAGSNLRMVNRKNPL